MNDTSPQIDARMKKIWREKDPAERLSMGCSMFDFAKELVGSRLRQERAGLSRQVERQQFFLHFYGDQFDAAQKEKILNHLLLIP